MTIYIYIYIYSGQFISIYFIIEQMFKSVYESFDLLMEWIQESAIFLK